MLAATQHATMPQRRGITSFACLSLFSSTSKKDPLTAPISYQQRSLKRPPNERDGVWRLLEGVSLRAGVGLEKKCLLLIQKLPRCTYSSQYVPHQLSMEAPNTHGNKSQPLATATPPPPVAQAPGRKEGRKEIILRSNSPWGFYPFQHPDSPKGQVARVSGEPPPCMTRGSSLRPLSCLT